MSRWSPYANLEGTSIIQIDRSRREIVAMQEVIPRWNGKGSRQGRLLEQGLWKGRLGVNSSPLGEVWGDPALGLELVHVSLACFPSLASVKPASSAGFRGGRPVGSLRAAALLIRQLVLGMGQGHGRGQGHGSGDWPRRLL